MKIAKTKIFKREHKYELLKMRTLKEVGQICEIDRTYITNICNAKKSCSGRMANWIVQALDPEKPVEYYFDDYVENKEEGK